MSEPEPALFYRRIPYMQLLADEQRSALDWMKTAQTTGLTHYHQMMLLSAGSLGVVIPILATQRPAVLIPLFAKRAAVAFGANIFLGAVIQGVGRWLMVITTTRIAEHFGRVNVAVWEAPDDEDAIREAVHRAAAQFDPAALGWITKLGGIGDVLFYSAFLFGVGFLMAGFI